MLCASSCGPIAFLCAADDFFVAADKISDFELKLMDIDAETLGIPDTEYQAIVKMPGSEFQRICTNLTQWGDSVVVAANKEGVKFSVSGEIGNGNIAIKPNADVDNVRYIVHLDIISHFMMDMFRRAKAPRSSSTRRSPSPSP